jgi:hypothetical protein
MKRFIQILSIVLILAAMVPSDVYAGNPQRAGEAGASFLLLNPWAPGSGWGGANTARCEGLESTFLNVAGSAFLQKTELNFTHTNLYSGAGISLNAFGFSQKVGEAGVLSMSVVSLDYGEEDITTVNQPEGGIGTFHPQESVIGISFAKEFSNSIYGGMTVKILNSAISDVAASGVAFDAGIQYVTGNQEQLRFGIAMKNVGPTAKFQGDGISFRGTIPETEVDMTVEQRSAAFELPSLITIGIAYDVNFTQDVRLTPALNFTSNAFTKDQFHFGAEFAYKKILFLRGGYVHEKDIDSSELSETLYTGWSYGFSLQVPLNKETGSFFSIDYSYRTTNPFLGVHSVGARISL